MDIPGLPARRAALQMLDAVLRRGDTLDMAEGPATKRIANFADRALARAIAGDVLRWLTDLDAMIDSATRNNLAEDAKVRTVLRIMLAQWLRLDTPPHAIISTGLPLLSGGPRKLAHGVFSALLKREGKLPDHPTLPDYVAGRWGERAPAIAAALSQPPPLDLALKAPEKTAEWAEKLEGVSFAPGHVRLPRGHAIEDLPGFADGEWWVQDFAASLPVRLLGEGKGRTVLDLCAAPGGKTLQLAAAGWKVTALDVSEKRLRRLHENLKRLGLEADIVVANALKWKTERRFDAILLDAPCTATGTARRHPDVIHRIGPRQIEEMSDLQSDLLAKAGEWLAPEGRLVYATCSLEPEEGEAQAIECKLKPDPIKASELPEMVPPTPQGWLRTDPGMIPEQGGMDGFFVARFQA
ncbi:RsmB/NOP family class I SAM-dependent RNA methyltransferase [Altererythrobacter sp. ZODW24]|uniref:RsmB/NOP family class I SAM-dependent RNA methyltransferase n=1 Tax=Altererythrobacter sp. ZODW24 TaxID=2185142 RepID=UPI000DF7FB1C|nr:RsmB/NOP family class I SAM-dependent RNA methyltransferase [Altererythrobacter sp. ZODW24]